MIKEIFPPTDNQSQTLAEALKHAGADFVAEQVPIFQDITETDAVRPDLTFGQIPGYSVIRRGDSKIPLGVVSARYGLSQYKDTLSFLDDLVGEKEALFNSVAITDDGARIYVSMRAPNSVVFAPGDEIQCYYTASTSHDGTGSIQFMCSPIHSRTQTILTSLDFGVIKMRHSVHVKNRLARAAGTIKKMQDVWANHADSFVKFAGMPLDDIEAKTYFCMLVPGNEDSTEIHPRTQNTRDKLFDIYKVGVASQLPSCKGTLLGAFVASLIFGDYYKTIRESIVGRSERDARIESRLSGSAARFKADSFASALKLMRM